MIKWDGRIIPTVSVDDVEYIICQHYEDSTTLVEKFKLFLEKRSAKTNLKLLGNMASIWGAM